MTAIALGFGLLIAVLAAASRAHAAGVASSAKALPPGAGDAAVAAAKKVVATGDPKKMAQAAIVAHQAGNAPLATALANAAKKTQYADPNFVYKTPFLEPNTQQWNAFVHGIRGPDYKAITPGYFLGMFGMGMRRLVDLGLATNPHKAQYKGRTVWNGDWKPPLTLDVFLQDPELQYQTFVKAMTADAAQIKKEMPEAIGATLDGDTVTMSGLLAVSKNAGLAGLRTWIGSADVRKQHKATTAQFKKLNGVF